MTQMLEKLKFAKGIDPVANGFAGTVRSDVYNLAQHGRILFVVYCGVGTTGTSTITVNACDDITPSNRTAIPFWYREILATDVDGAITLATTAGFTTTAGSSRIALVEADARLVGGASVNGVNGCHFVELTMIESAASAVLGGVMAIFGGFPLRYAKQVNATVLA